MMRLSTRCHHCGESLVLDECRSGGYLVHCDRCLDPMGDSPVEWLQGRGETMEDALQHWFDRREELGLEPESTITALASFVVPPSPEGWEFTIPTPGYVGSFESLAGAEGFAHATHSHGPLPIHYGPALSVKKASNS